MMKYLVVLLATLMLLRAGAVVFALAAEPPRRVDAVTRTMTTIQDVARHAAVSVSTVSNVLNGRADRMRPETLARVEAAIEALQLPAEQAARSS